MLLEHIGFVELGSTLHKALDICGQHERKIAMTGRDSGATSTEYAEYLMQVVQDPDLEARWDSYLKAE